MAPAPVALAGRTIGPGHPCLVIAEAGVNHNGSAARAHQLVDAAADAGADAVKFQTFRADRLVTAAAPKAAYQIAHTGPAQSQHDMLKALELAPEVHAELQAHATRRGLLFLSTPFDEDSADLLERLDVPAFKVPSGELTNLPFLTHLARKGKPLIVSTGMAGLGEVEAAVQTIEANGAPGLVLLHCVSNYPADPADSNLRVMATLAAAFGVPTGFSDHTLGTAVPLAATALGASVIEKHFTLDRTLPGPDHKASAEPAELAALVAGIRLIALALGDGRKRPAASEADTAAVARRSLVAAADIPEGTTLTPDLIALRRPGTGLPPALQRFLLGRKATAAIPAGTLLRLEDGGVRTIGVVTGARSDYGIYRPLLRKLRAHPGADLRLFVTGMHLAPEFGLTVKAIEADGFPIAERVETLLASDTPGGIAASMGLGVIGFGQAFARWRPDILVVLGDRFEMHAAALAALPFKLPVAHVHGGEVTEGAIDDALRHSLTKLSHLHFVSADAYATRVTQLGEEPWRVTVCGAPGLDDIATVPRMSVAELEARVGLPLDPPPLLVTFHPVTLEYEQSERQVRELLAALDGSGRPVVFTRPNADTRGRAIAREIEAFVHTHPNCRSAGDLGTEAYFGLMAVAAAMVGNSSSGIIEAPSFRLPVVNVGNRQRGRHRAANVIDVGHSREEILAGIRRATRPEFRARELRDLANPFDRGGAADIIVRGLLDTPLGDELVVKRFHDLPTEMVPCRPAA